jgi:hypothetical protein
MSEFRRAAELRAGAPMTSTPDVHLWSLEDPDAFWSLVWEHFGVVGERGARAHVPSDLPRAVFFPDSRVNLAENLLAPWAASDEEAAVCCGVEGSAVVVRESVTGRELVDRVAAVAAFLRDAGVMPGDRVALVMPVDVDALACTLGVLAIGAIVSTVSPEFGAAAILDRLEGVHGQGSECLADLRGIHPHQQRHRGRTVFQPHAPRVGERPHRLHHGPHHLVQVDVGQPRLRRPGEDHQAADHVAGPKRLIDDRRQPPSPLGVGLARKK